MSHKEQEDLIKKLIDSFSPEVLVRFLGKKGGDFRFLREKYAPVENFTDIELLAQKELEDNNRFGVWAIKTQAELSERSGKKKQFELAKTYSKMTFLMLDSLPSMTKLETLDSPLSMHYTREKR